MCASKHKVKGYVHKILDINIEFFLLEIFTIVLYGESWPILIHR